MIREISERDNRTNSTHQRQIEGSKIQKWNHIKIKKSKMQFWSDRSVAVSLNLQYCFAVLLITFSASRASSGT